MAEGKPCDCEIVPTSDSRVFRFRLRLSSPEAPLATTHVHASTVVAGCNCIAAYTHLRPSSKIQVVLSLRVRPPILDGAAKISTHMVFLDKTGSPARSMRMTMFSAPGFLIANRDDVIANCVVDNYFVVMCFVDIDWTTASSEEELPDLGHDLAIMWDKQEHTDVSFNIGGECFYAHRLVLAARSPVFKAELYGPMAESKMASITIQDMEASTFRSMLHYMYHGSLPNNDGKTDSFTLDQHLLVAADRYGLVMLKKICEDKLCANGIKLGSVVSLLELAEDHSCSKLKARCFDFLAGGDNFKVVATSGEYLHLMQTYPNLLVEARDRFKIPHEKPTIMESGSHKKARLC
ncbi:BTB/POZ and MATH domain-containing protein 1-like [Lolium rigidum]|uniref:BTB/POZ and MATH domain-containing protein 1-like n=1 Tax=Lolium rigidum TaxID=89674 RepID=UPI001F5C78A3|nr:BTB/POZ and MATH domain-containing protein 1-like [Lolium rigidum]